MGCRRSILYRSRSFGTAIGAGEFINHLRTTTLGSDALINVSVVGSGLGCVSEAKLGGRRGGIR